MHLPELKMGLSLTSGAGLMFSTAGFGITDEELIKKVYYLFFHSFKQHS
jgi:hypothetical protein